MAASRDKDYETIASAIREHGEPNNSFPNDRDIEFGKLKTVCASVMGIQTILKNMKGKGLVDFGAQGFFKDTDVITLVYDQEAEAISQQLTVKDVPDDPNMGHHLRTSGW